MSQSRSRKVSFKGRTTGRLVAVQALFQIEQTKESASAVVLEFMTHRLKEGETRVSKSTTSFFTKLVEGTWKTHEKSDEMIRATLKPGWTLERIEPVTRAILRAALYEVLESQTPAAVIMDEYLTITHRFFDEKEVAFVNGVLNAIARKVRPA
jgi:N utilization substance protein B